MNTSLENKVSLVTGGNSGIGKAQRSCGFAPPEASFITGTDIAVDGGYLAK